MLGFMANGRHCNVQSSEAGIETLTVRQMRYWFQPGLTLGDGPMEMQSQVD